MIFKDFNKIKISSLGMGCLRFPCVDNDKNNIDRKKAFEIIDSAVSNKINYFDTAYTYQNGDSERVTGEALSRYDRESYLLATKYYAASHKDIESVFAEQLKRLKTDYIDFYLLHGVDENNIGMYMNEALIEFLLRKKQEGAIRFIGFSSHCAVASLERFLNWYDGFDMAQIQLNFIDHSLLDGKGQYEMLTKHNIPVWVMEPLKGGRLSTLDETCAKMLTGYAPGRSLSSWGFRYLMGFENIVTVLSGMSDIAQVEENAALFSLNEKLTENESILLEEVKDLFIRNMGVACSECRYCTATCPAKLDIPLLIKCYNEMRLCGDTWRIGSVPKDKTAKSCLACGECAKRCPQKIDIPKVMSILAEAED